MKPLKKQHHYIWKEYLKPWTTQNRICCLRNGQSFQASLDKIGKKRFFYESQKLGPVEIEFLTALIRNAIPNVAASMKTILELYIQISNSSDEYQIKCGIEDLHMLVENYGKNCLNKLRNGNMEFLKNDREKHQLSLFLGVQYMRTNKMRQNLNPEELENKNLDLEKLSVILPFIYGEIIGKWIYNVGQVSLLINETKLNFITGDQPIFNTKATQDNSNELTLFELYYPISPKYAIFIDKEKEERIVLKEKEVRAYNKLMEKHSLEQLYAKNENDFISV